MGTRGRSPTPRVPLRNWPISLRLVEVIVAITELSFCADLWEKWTVCRNYFRMKCTKKWNKLLEGPETELIKIPSTSQGGLQVSGDRCRFTRICQDESMFVSWRVVCLNCPFTWGLCRCKTNTSKEGRLCNEPKAWFKKTMQWLIDQAALNICFQTERGSMWRR